MAVDTARADNLAERNPQGLMRYLESAPVMSETAFYGLLCAIQCGPGLIKCHAVKLQVATLQYISRLQGTMICSHAYW